LHAAAQTQNQMKRAFLLDVIIGKGSTIL
jgi:hypothetical protein